MPASDTTLGQLVVRLLMDKKQFDKATKEASGEIADLSKTFDSIGDALSTTVKRGFEVATAAIVGFAAGSALIGEKFEYAITQVGAVSGATAEEITRLSKTARQIGIDTAFTATQAAEAMHQLAQAGLKTDQVIAASKNAVLLAGATGATLEQSTKLIVSSMEQFQISAGDTKRITDVFTKALNATTFDISSLTEAMKYAGVTGAGLGYTLEDTTASVAMFRNLGLEGSLAGTAFKMAMADAAKSTKQQNDALKKYNLTMKDISSETHSFAQIMETVGKAGITTSDAMTVFGVRAGAAVATIASQFGDGTTKFYQVQKALYDSAGTAAKTYETMMNTVHGQFDIAMSSIQELFLIVFDQYKAPLATLLGTLADTINYVGNVFRQRTGTMREGLAELFGDWTKWLKENRDEIAGWFVAIVNAVTQIGSAFAAILPYLTQIAAAMVAIFIAQKVYSFVVAVQGAVVAVQAFAAATTEAAAAEALASGGLIPLAAAIVSITAVLGTYAAAMLSAKDAAESLAAAEAKVRAGVEAQDAKLLAHIKEVLPAQQERINQILKEKAATGELTDEEVRRLQALQGLTAEQAAQKVQAGDLIELNGELVEVAGVVADQGNQGVAIVEDQAKAYDAASESAKAHGKALDAQIKSYEELKAKGYEFADMVKYGGKVEGETADDMYALREEALRQEEQNAAVAKNLRDQAANEQAKELQAANAAGKKERAAEFADEAGGIDKLAKKRADAAEKDAEIERQLAEEVSAINRGKLGDIEVAEQKRIASVTRTFDDEIALYAAGSAEAVALEKRKQAAITEVTVLADKERHDYLLKQAQDDVDAEIAARQGFLDFEVAAKHENDKKIAALEYDRDKQLAEFWNGTEEQREAITAYWQAKIDKTKAEGAVTAEEYLHAGVKRANDIERDRLALLESMEGASAEEIAKVNAKYDRQIAADKIKTAIATIGKIKDAAVGAVNEVTSKVYGLFQQMTGFSLDIMGVMGDILQAQKDKAAGEETYGATTGTGAADELVTGGLELIQTLTDAIGPFLEELAARLPDLIDAFVKAIPKVVRAILAALPAILQAVLDGIPSIIRALANGITQIIQALPALIGQILDALPGIVETFMEALPGILRALMLAIPQIVDEFVKAIPKIIVAFINGLPKLINVLVRNFPMMAIKIIEALVTLMPELVYALITDLVPQLPAIAIGFVKALINGLWAAVKEIGAFAQEVFEEALGWFAELFDKDGALGKNGAIFGNGKDDVGLFKDIGQLFNGDKSDNSFASGLNYVPATMRVTVHPGEMIVPARNARRAYGTADYGTPPPLPGPAPRGGTTELAVVIGEQVVDQVTCSALDHGRAPKLARRIARAGGAVKGYSRGKFNAYGG